jgi:hypothetical protein
MEESQAGSGLARLTLYGLAETKPMKTFLRDMATRHYFASVRKWTLDRDDAYDFGVASKAVKLAHKLRLPNLELEVSFDEAQQAQATPFATFVQELSHPGRRRMAAH